MLALIAMIQVSTIVILNARDIKKRKREENIMRNIWAVNWRGCHYGKKTQVLRTSSWDVKPPVLVYGSWPSVCSLLS